MAIVDPRRLRAEAENIQAIFPKINRFLEILQSMNQDAAMNISAAVRTSRQGANHVREQIEELDAEDTSARRGSIYLDLEAAISSIHKILSDAVKCLTADRPVARPRIKCG
jgi:hypothetical protein